MQIIGKVSKVTGKFVAEAKDGTIRVLQVGNPVYEGEAIYQQASTDENTASDNATTNLAIASFEATDVLEQSEADNGITIILDNGETKHLTDVGYLMLDAAVIGEDLTSLLPGSSNLGNTNTHTPVGRSSDSGTQHSESSNPLFISNNAGALGTPELVNPLLPGELSPQLPPPVDFDNRLPDNPFTLAPLEPVIAANKPPVAVADDYIAVLGSAPGSYSLDGNVLHNDADPDIDPLSVVQITHTSTSVEPHIPLTGKYGTITINANGTLPTSPTLTSLS